MKYFIKIVLLYELKLKLRILNELNHESGGQFHIIQIEALCIGRDVRADEFLEEDCRGVQESHGDGLSLIHNIAEENLSRRERSFAIYVEKIVMCGTSGRRLGMG
jgi:hypothetical protein